MAVLSVVDVALSLPGFEFKITLGLNKKKKGEFS